jgi:hypothetical protein
VRALQHKPGAAVCCSVALLCQLLKQQQAVSSNQVVRGSKEPASVLRCR